MFANHHAKAHVHRGKKESSFNPKAYNL